MPLTGITKTKKSSQKPHSNKVRLKGRRPWINSQNGERGAICSVIAIIALVKTNHQELRIVQQGLALIGNVEGCRRDPYHRPPTS